MHFDEEFMRFLSGFSFFVIYYFKFLIKDDQVTVERKNLFCDTTEINSINAGLFEPLHTIYTHQKV